MTNDEALISAAKAAGITLRDNWGNFLEIDSRGCCHCWLPYNNDAQAMRLAVKLWLEVRHVHGAAHAGMPNRFWCTERWFPDGDQYAATRRAIVLAAAKIGEAG